MLGPACSHGVRWDDPCKECEIVSLRETIEVFEPKVIRAKQRLAELTQPTPETRVCNCGPNEACGVCAGLKARSTANR
jgi:hypothetical protein